MAARSPARFLAPLALLGFAVALFLVISNGVTDDSPSGATGKRATPVATATANGGASARKGPRYYRVKAGDTPSSIAERTGVPLSQIQQLNPDLDPQTLAPGERIRLRR